MTALYCRGEVFALAALQMLQLVSRTDGMTTAPTLLESAIGEKVLRRPQYPLAAIQIGQAYNSSFTTEEGCPALNLVLEFEGLFSINQTRIH